MGNVFIWTVRLIALLVILTGMVGCTVAGLNYASLETTNKKEAWPPLTEKHLDRLQTDRDAAISELETYVFGPFPAEIPTQILSRRIVDPDYAGGRAVLEEYLVQIGDTGIPKRFYLVVAFPKNTQGPVPVIINQTFGPNRMSFKSNALSPPINPGSMDFGGDVESNSLAMRGVRTVFGEFISTPPNELILDRGYAMASFFASDIIPDSPAIGRSSLTTFPEGARGQPTGAVAAWAAGYIAALDVLEADPRIDATRTAILGHSRHAKSALVAGAIDPRIEAVVSHQSGTGGAALSRFKVGESVSQITRSYPHWFDPAYASFDAAGAYATPVDMHMLIALNAPKKLFLGNARRDVWSDPNGTYRAALAADAAWKARGLVGMQQDGMNTFNPEADLVFFMRPGFHGIDKRDWAAFLDFLDAAFQE